MAQREIENGPHSVESVVETGDEIREELERSSFRRLAPDESGRGERTVPEHHSGVRAVIDWFYR